MSVVLFVVENGRERAIWRLSQTRAHLFWGITRTAASTYRVPVGLYDDDGGPSWRVEPEEFCTLVEKVFAQPADQLYPWAQYAAAIYEALKGERYTWYWNRYHVPSITDEFEPLRSVDSPQHGSGKYVGSGL